MPRFRQRDRDLLFSVFALQLGYADAAQLATAVAAWSSRPDDGLADHLVRQAEMPATAAASLWGLVDAAVEASDGDVEKTVAKVWAERPEQVDEVVAAVVDAARPAPEQTLASLGLDDTYLRATEARGELEVTVESPGRYVSPTGDEEEELGRGGLGRVYVRFDRHLGRDVAVKELLQSAASAAENANLLREARISGHLEHPSIIPVYELGRRVDGRLYYTMKWVRGRTLRTALTEVQDLAGRLRLLDNFVDVAQALAYAHSRGVIHRDVKPANVLLGAFGETLLVDWGIAKLKGHQDDHHDLPSGQDSLHVMMSDQGTGSQTVPGSAVGTPQYMSPEQARGDLEAIDERSDVWGLGGILFEILTGRPPYSGGSAKAVVAKVLEGPPPRVRDVVPDVPADLAAVADKALAYRPDDRYPTANELAEDVTAYLAGERVRAYAYGSLELARRFFERNRAGTLAVLVMLLGLVVGSVVTFAAYRREGEARAESERRERLVHAYLAKAYLEKAERLLEDFELGKAELHAAAARYHHPSSLGSPWRVGTSTAFSDEDFTVRVRSVLHRLSVDRRLFHRCRVPTTEALFWGDDGEEVIAYTPNTTTATVWSLETCAVDRYIELPPIPRMPIFRASRSWRRTLAIQGPRGLAVVQPDRDEMVRFLGPSDIKGFVLLDDPDHVITYRTEGTRFVLELREVAGGAVLHTSDPFPAGDGTWFGVTKGNEALFYSTGENLDVWPLPALAPHRTLPISLGHNPQLAVLEDTLVIGNHLGVKAVDATTLSLRWQRADIKGVPIPCGAMTASTLAVVHEAVQLLDAKNGRTLEHVGGRDCLVSPSGARLLTKGNGFSDVWAVRAPAKTQLAQPAPSLHSFEISPDGRWLTTAGGSTDGWVELFDLATGARRLRVEAAGPVPPAVGFSTNSERFAVASAENLIRIYRTGSSPQLVTSLSDLPVERPVFIWRDVQFDPAGRELAWLSQANPEVLQRFDLERGVRLDDHPLGLRFPSAIRYGPKGHRLVVSGSDGIEIYERDALRRVASLPSEMEGFVLAAIDVSPQGWLAAAGVEGRTWLYRLDDPEEQFVLTAPHLGPQGTVRFSPDGKLLCVGDDTQLVVWDVEARRQHLRVPDTGEACGFTRDGRHLVAELGGSGLYRFPLDVESIEIAADQLLTRAEARHPSRLPRE